MSSFKINIALIQQCPPLLTLKAALETVGRPSDKDYGVRSVGDIIEGKLTFEFFQTREQNLPQVDKQDGSMRKINVHKDNIFQCAVRIAPHGARDNGGDLGVLEVYSGSASSIDKVSELLAVLELADHNPQVNFISLDIMAKLSDLRDDAKLFRVLGAKVTDYKDEDEKIAGTYSVKFPKDLEAGNAWAFLQEHADDLVSVKVKVRRDELSKPITLTVRPSAYFTLSAPDTDETRALNVCRRFAGTLAALARKEPAADAAAIDEDIDETGGPK